MELVEEDKSVVAAASRVPYYPLAVKRGRGAEVEDMDGNRYIDFLSSAAALNTGHCHPRVVEAVKEQAEELLLYTAVYMYHEPLVRLSRRLCSVTPGDFRKRVIYGLSGSDANDGMIKLARWYTGRSKIIAFQRSYHGTTYGAMTLSALSLNMRRRMGPMLPEVYHFPSPDPYRTPVPMSEEEAARYHIGRLEEAFANYIPPEEVAAVIVEPIQGDAGLVIPPQGFLQRLRELCDEHGILFVSEEVQQGFGRTGRWFGIEHFDVVPDAVILGKSIASGMPLSAIVARAEIMEQWQPPAHCFTCAGHPVGCRAALATLDVIEEEGLVERSERLGARAMQELGNMQEEFELIGDVRGRGLSIGVDLVKNRATRERNTEAAAKICYWAWQNGLILSFFSGSVLRIQPPLVIAERELDTGLRIIRSAIEAYLRDEIPDSVLETVKGW
ncbi:MAG: aspartate aminotransferase family protein [Synergistales bacterium]|nr:aspartate aminotransferase family protein [Synergistales bacterium]